MSAEGTRVRLRRSTAGRAAPLDGRPSLLLVEDEESVALTLGAVLEDEGYRVETAASVDEGLARAVAERFDAAVLDLHVAGSDGLTVLRRLKERSPTTVAVVLSGYASVASALDAIRLGVDGYLVKPCDLDELKATIARGRERVARAASERAALVGAAQEARERLAAVVEHMPVGVVLAEAPSGRMLVANPAVARVWRQPFIQADDVSGYVSYVGYHPDGRQYQPEEWPLERAVRTGEVVTGEVVDIQRGDGTRGVIRNHAAPLRDASGAITAGIVVFEDVTDEIAARRAAEAASHRTERLQDLAATLARALTPTDAARAVIRELRAALGAEAGLVALADSGGTSLEIVASIGYPDAVMARWHRFPVDSPMPGALAFRTRRMVAHGSRAEAEELVPGLGETMAGNGHEAIVAAPLLVDDRTLGVLVVSFRRGRGFESDDREFIWAFADQCAQAVDRGLLFAEARRNAERTAQLQAVAADLAAAATPEQVASAVVRQALTALGASRGAVARIVDDGAAFEVMREEGTAEDAAAQAEVARWQRFSVAAATTFGDAVRGGEPVVLETRAERLARYPHMDAAQSALRLSASVTAPLIAGGQPIGALYLAFAEERPFDDEDRAFVVALARLCATALDRAHLYDEERRARAEAEAARARLRVLADASDAFAAARLDAPATFAAVAQRVVALTGGGAVLYAVQDDGSMPLAAHEHPDPAVKAAIEQVLAGPPRRVGEGPAGRVAATGQGALIAVDPAQIEAVTSPLQRDLLDRLRLGSLLYVPLRVGGKVIGVLGATGRADAPPLGPEDQALLQELADRAAQAIENARLFGDLQESEERYRAVVEQSTDAIVVVEGTVSVYVNDAYLRLIGVDDRSRVLGSTGAEWTHPDDVGLVVERALARQRGEPVPPVYEFRVVRADGAVRTVEVAATPITRGGRPATLAVLRDVTARKRAETSQRLLAEASAALGSSLDYETTLSAVAGLLVPGLADWCTVYVEEEGELRRVGAAHADPALAAVVDELAPVYPRDPAGSDSVVRVVETGQPLLVPSVDLGAVGHFARDPNQRELLRKLDPRSAIVAPLVARGHVLGAIGLNRTAGAPYDADDLALAVELSNRCAVAIDNARLYREARDAVQARDQFLSLAAHELKTPMTALKGNAQLALRAKQSGRLDDARLERLLGLVDEASSRLARLTDDLLDVSRLRSGRLDLRLEVVDLGALVERVVERHREQSAETHGLRLKRPKRAIPVSADAGRLEQVLDNLLSNAVKYSPAGGAVDVSVGMRGGQAQVRVHDEGIGLPADALETIFTPFGRAANAVDRHVPGMGLGLYITRGIVEQHGGRIAAESAGEDEGTTFVVELPLGKG